MRIFVDSFIDAEGVSPNGRHRWEFSEMFGPLFVRKNGEPLKNQPPPGSAAWTAFQAWFDARNRAPHNPNGDA